MPPAGIKVPVTVREPGISRHPSDAGGGGVRVGRRMRSGTTPSVGTTALGRLMSHRIGYRPGISTPRCSKWCSTKGRRLSCRDGPPPVTPAGRGARGKAPSAGGGLSAERRER
ncbi:hypothetical protein GCM10022420_098320 [Streptomyces iranensis]